MVIFKLLTQFVFITSERITKMNRQQLFSLSDLVRRLWHRRQAVHRCLSHIFLMKIQIENHIP